MGGFLYGPAFFQSLANSSSRVTIGTGIPVVSPAGQSNNVNPGSGFPSGIGQLVVTSGGANANWTGLLAGSDGQLIEVIYNDVALFTLNNQNAASLAANRFLGANDITLTKGDSSLLIYNSIIAAWTMR